MGLAIPGFSSVAGKARSSTDMPMLIVTQRQPCALRDTVSVFTGEEMEPKRLKCPDGRAELFWLILLL